MTVAEETREARALQLYRAKWIELEEIAPDVWRVPSCSGDGAYTVDYRREECPCKDAEFAPPTRACKHMLCVGILYAVMGRRVD
jgi:hypothetical protein